RRFAVPTGAYYHYWAASNFGWPIHNRYLDTTKADYITRVLTARASLFLQANQANPFFLYYALTPPHGPASADALDVDRFNIIVAFMSDNGFSWGEHRWRNKMIPYNEDLRIPMRLVGKNLANPLAEGTVPRIVLNIDLLPTLEVMAGVTTSPSRPIAPEGTDM